MKIMALAFFLVWLSGCSQDPGQPWGSVNASNAMRKAEDAYDRCMKEGKKSKDDCMFDP